MFVFATSQAQACYTVKFKNQSKADVTVAWLAGGCGGITSGIAFVCTHKDVKANESKSYNFKWGTTLPSLKVYNTYTTYPSNGSKSANVAIEYVLNGGRFKTSGAPQSPPGCGKSYTVTLKDDKRKKAGL